MVTANTNPTITKIATGWVILEIPIILVRFRMTGACLVALLGWRKAL